MVCSTCEKKLGKIICPDKWKDGARNVTVGKDRKLNENKLLTKTKVKPYNVKCKLCKSTVHQTNAVYCQGCSYKKGLCAMCGKQILDVKFYKQSKV